MTETSAPIFTTSCVCCTEPVRYIEVWDEPGTFVWVDGYGRNGCPDPQQPDSGLFPHEPADRTPEDIQP